MSWDVLLMPFPADAASPDDLPDGHRLPAVGPVGLVLHRIRAAFPGADLSDPAWGLLRDEEQGWSMELNMGRKDPVESIMLHIRGGGDVVHTALRLAAVLGCRAVDCSDGEFLAEEGGGWEEFQAYRDQVLGEAGPS
ncbi:hypothetical protein ACFVWN_22790 [Nocardiopsis flavescens]|uniref:hypothetical protein n=1 Tax=Nocardiopsis flavescens TaxID=758803 RepID=UPI003666B201